MKYHLELTGFVGYENFNSKKTDNLLRQYPGKAVDVLIDSPGGSLAHGLSIAGAFRNHGEVTAHLRGMCASAATIAAMGAKKICIEPDAFFLVHKVLVSFFDWSMHNADSLQKYIEALQAQKKDLETLDSSVAATYAARCKKNVNELLELMKEGKWLTAQQALEWGFVDEVKGSEGSLKVPKMTKAQADAFAAQGIPLPPIEIEDNQKNDKSSLLKELKSFLKNPFNMNQKISEPLNETSPVAVSNPKNEDQAKSEPSADSDKEALQKEIDRLKAENEALKKEPGEKTTQALSTPEPKQPKAEKTEFDEFLEVNKSALDLFNSLP